MLYLQAVSARTRLSHVPIRARADDGWRLSLAVPLFTSPMESGEAPLPAVAEWLAANIHDEQQPAGASHVIALCRALACNLPRSCCIPYCTVRMVIVHIPGREDSSMPSMLKRSSTLSMGPTIVIPFLSCESSGLRERLTKLQVSG